MRIDTYWLCKVCINETTEKYYYAKMAKMHLMSNVCCKFYWFEYLESGHSDWIFFCSSDWELAKHLEISVLPL